MRQHLWFNDCSPLPTLKQYWVTASGLMFEIGSWRTLALTNQCHIMLLRYSRHSRCNKVAWHEFVTLAVSVITQAAYNEAILNVPWTLLYPALTIHHSTSIHENGVRIVQLVEHWTHDWEVAGLIPGRSSRRNFLSRIKLLCWLLFRCLFHPHVTAMACKRP